MYVGDCFSARTVLRAQRFSGYFGQARVVVAIETQIIANLWVIEIDWTNCFE